MIFRDESAADLSTLTPYLALAIYPLAFFLGFSVNPIEFSWTFKLARRRRSIDEPMPAEVRDRAEAVTRYLNFLVDALVLVFIVILLRRTGLGAGHMGLQFANWEHDAIFGLTAGIFLVATQSLTLRRVPIDPRHAFTYQVRRGSPVLWVFIFVTGAFSEELWIAVCLVFLRTTAHSAAISVAVTIAVFAAMHYSYRFWGTVAVAAKGTISALLFLHSGSVIVTFFCHFVGNLGSLYWNRYWRR